MLKNVTVFYQFLSSFLILLIFARAEDIFNLCEISYEKQKITIIGYSLSL